MFQLPVPVLDANAGSGASAFGKLPEWNLDDLYTGEDAPELKRWIGILRGHSKTLAADIDEAVARIEASVAKAEAKLAKRLETHNGDVERLNKRIEGHLCAVEGVRRLDGFGWTNGRCDRYDDSQHHCELFQEG